MDDDPRVIMDWVAVQLARGVSPEDIDAHLAARRQAGEGTFPNAFSARMAMESTEDFLDAEEMTQMTGGEDAGRLKQGLAAVQNFLGSAAQGATFGFADEAVGLASPAAGQSLREAQNRRSTHAPTADVMSQIAGGLMIPASVGTGAARMAPGAARGALAGGARMAVAGAAGGAAAGAGFADPRERAGAAKTGALFGGAAGAVLGAPFGAVGGFLAAQSGRGGRVGALLQDLTGRDRTINEIRDQVVGDLDRVSGTLYKEVEALTPAATLTPELESVLLNIGSDPATGRHVPVNLRPRNQNVGGVRVRAPNRDATFQDLQTLRTRLRKSGAGTSLEASAAQDADAMLTRAMQDVFGEPLIMADEAWHGIQAQSRGAEAGWANWNKLSADLDEVAREVQARASGEAVVDATEAFHDGRVARMVVEMNRRNKEAVPVLKAWMDAGPETFDQMRPLFQADHDFTTFQRMLRSEARSAAVFDFFNSSIKSAAIGATGGAITGGLMSRGREN